MAVKERSLQFGVPQPSDEIMNVMKFQYVHIAHIYHDKTYDCTLTFDFYLHSTKSLAIEIQIAQIAIRCVRMRALRKSNHTLEISHFTNQVNEKEQYRGDEGQADIFCNTDTFCVNKSQKDAIASHFQWSVAPDFFFSFE